MLSGSLRKAGDLESKERQRKIFTAFHLRAERG